MIKLLTVLTIMTLNLYSHTLVLNIFDNEDDTITISGAFSTGQLATGALVKIEALNNAKVLYKQRLPEESEITIKIPKEPYQIVLDGGPGHQLVKKGLPPKDGFEVALIKNEESNQKLSTERSFTKEWSLPYIVLIAITLLLILLTVYFSKRNTDKILKSIEELKKGI